MVGEKDAHYYTKDENSTMVYNLRLFSTGEENNFFFLPKVIWTFITLFDDHYEIIKVKISLLYRFTEFQVLPATALARAD